MDRKEGKTETWLGISRMGRLNEYVTMLFSRKNKRTGGEDA